VESALWWVAERFAVGKRNGPADHFERRNAASLGERPEGSRTRSMCQKRTGVMRLKRFSFLVVLLSAALLHGCTEGKRPFLIVQMCLGDKQSLSEFTSMMQLIAQAEQMTFTDDSVQTKKDLEVIGALPKSGPVINMSIDGKGGIGLMVSQLDSHDYQVAVGFSEGSNPSAAHAFAGRVVERLKTHWHVDTVSNPAEQGAVPKKKCEK
jgi:hypothetical protein